MITIKSCAWNNPSGIAYLSDEVYEVVRDVFNYSTGDLVRPVGDTPETIGVHALDSDWASVSPHDAKTAVYCGVPKDALKLVSP